VTDEQVEKLKPPLCCGIHEDLVARLLEERRRLLGALREIASEYGDGPGRGDMWARIVARAALTEKPEDAAEPPKASPAPQP